MPDTAPAQYSGYLDGVWPNGEIYGWALDRNHSEHRLEVQFYINHAWYGSTKACEYRPDVRDAGFGDGYNGFWLRSFTLDILQERVKPGDMIQAYFDKERQHELNHSPLILDKETIIKVRSTLHISERLQNSDEPIHFKMHSLCGGDHVVKLVQDHGLISYEYPLPQVIYQSIKALPGLFLDIGANTGLFSLMTASIGETKSIAFEPLPKIHEILKRNIQINGFSDRIDAERLAVSNLTGHLKFYIPPNIGLIETSASLEPEFKKQHSEVIEVESTTLDDYLNSRGLGSRSVSVIKIDVEGHEPSVIEGALKTIQRHRPIIVVEILPTANNDYFSQLIRELNYRDIVFIDKTPYVHTQTRYFPKQHNHVFAPNEMVNDVVTSFSASLSQTHLQLTEMPVKPFR